MGSAPRVIPDQTFITRLLRIRVASHYASTPAYPSLSDAHARWRTSLHHSWAARQLVRVAFVKKAAAEMKMQTAEVRRPPPPRLPWVKKAAKMKMCRL